MEIKKLEKKDIDLIERIGKQEESFLVNESGDSFWSKEILESWCESKNDSLYIAKEENEIIGFCFISNHIPTKKATIENIWVDNNYRNKGIAKQILNESITNVKSKGAEYICSYVEIENKQSQKLFTSKGFDIGKKYFWMDKELK